MDNKTTIQELKLRVKKYCEDRDWDKFHNPKDLSIALSTEASELLELFLWKSNEQIEKMLQKPEKKQEIKEEMADILYVLLRLAQMNEIDLSAEFEKKMVKNAEKYPIDIVKGKNNKYTEYKK